MTNLTPYDTGERLEPKVWWTEGIDYGPNPVPQAQIDARFGKVDFDDDTSTTLATVHTERVDGTYVVVVYSHETGIEQRINLFTDKKYEVPQLGADQIAVTVTPANPLGMYLRTVWASGTTGSGREFEVAQSGVTLVLTLGGFDGNERGDRTVDELRLEDLVKAWLTLRGES